MPAAFPSRARAFGGIPNSRNKPAAKRMAASDSSGIWILPDRLAFILAQLYDEGWDISGARTNGRSEFTMLVNDPKIRKLLARW